MGSMQVKLNNKDINYTEIQGDTEKTIKQLERKLKLGLVENDEIYQGIISGLQDVKEGRIISFEKFKERMEEEFHFSKI